MDIDLARTFLEVVRTGSFMAAAERLHVTQTAVTARIHLIWISDSVGYLSRSRSESLSKIEKASQLPEQRLHQGN